MYKNHIVVFLQLYNIFSPRNNPYGSEIGPVTTPRPNRPRPQSGYIDVRINLARTRFPLREKILIPCTVNSYSRPTVQWKKNGSPIRSTRRIRVRKYLVNYLGKHNHLILLLNEQGRPSGTKSTSASSEFQDFLFQGTQYML